MFKRDRRHLNTDSDSEVLLNVLAHEIQKSISNFSVEPSKIFDVVSALHQRVKGSYAVVAQIAGHGILAFRDPFGIRPLCIGFNNSESGPEYIVASESVALESLGFHFLRDVMPGEAIYIDNFGNFFNKQCAKNSCLFPCIFEFVYLARPDSVIDGASVYATRLKMGEYLAKKVRDRFSFGDIDVVMPIPDSSRPSALELALTLNLNYREGFIKNRYIGRTFLMPEQAGRKKSVRQKLSAITSEFNGKSILIVDDSIVRGTTSREIVQMARDAGARKVIFASAAPPVKFANVYGIDMPTRSELIAHGKNEEEVCREITADALVYQDLEAMKQSITDVNPKLKSFEASCFDGEYITGDISVDYLNKVEFAREKSKNIFDEVVRNQLNLNLEKID
tara:strand:- start:462 stop:1640 length:1179 start_codon:yes stop_codon:yes gene_type:complete